jgi:hypothetical protein
MRIPVPMKTVCALSLVLVASSLAAGEVRTRYHAYTERWAERPDRAAVLGATRFGGSGTEWFAAGAILPDGRVIAAGSALGPALDARGTPVQVIGKDSKTPESVPPLADAKARWMWSNPAATGFIVRYAPGLGSVETVIRLPWGAGGITALTVDAEGAVYAAGPAGSGFEAIGAFDEVQPASPTAGAKGPAPAAWVAKFSPDLKRVQWLRRITFPTPSPSLGWTADGDLRLHAGDVYVFAPTGALRRSQVVQAAGRTDKGGTRFAVNPVDGRIAIGGDRQWPTGREPYRDPWLHIFRPDGAFDLQLYWWNGGYIGLDNVRLESDSDLRILRWTDDGDLLFSAWSDGGNSVFNRMPFDIRRNAPNMARLGMDGWGMNVLSQAWIIRLDGATWQVKAGTNWLSYLASENKPNGITIDSLGIAADGSVMIAGGSAWGLIRTGNHLPPGGAPGGRYVAVLSPGLDSLRFSSCLPGSGTVNPVNNEPVAFASGVANGRPMALMLTGATEKGSAYGDVWQAPTTVGAAQTAYGGGMLDAHLVLLDLGKGGRDAALTATEPVERAAPKPKAAGPDLPSGLDDLPSGPARPAGPAPATPGAGDEAWLKD